MIKKFFSIIIVFSIFIFPVNAGGGPLYYSGSYGIFGYVELSDIAEPDYSFEIVDMTDYHKMTNILFRYYNTYNLKRYKGQDILDVTRKIEELQNTINTYDCERNCVSGFSLSDSTSEATFDIFEEFGLGEKIYIDDYNSSGYESSKFKQVYDIEVDFRYIRNKKLDQEKLLDNYDIYQVINLTQGYNLSNLYGQYNLKLPPFIDEQDIGDYKVLQITLLNGNDNIDLKKSIDIQNDLGINVENLKEEFLIQIGYYIKENNNYIKIPTIHNFNYHYSIYDNFKDKVEDEYKFLCSDEISNRIKDYFNDLEFNTPPLEYQTLLNGLKRKLSNYLTDVVLNEQFRISNSVDSFDSFNTGLEEFRRESEKEVLYSCIHQNVFGGSGNEITDFMSELLHQIDS